MSSELVTFEIESGDMKSFVHEFAKLVKRAAKLGVTAPTFAVVQADKVYPAKLHPITNEVVKPARVVQVVTVSGQAPRLSGWLFVAALTHEADGNIVRRVPGTEGVQVALDLRTAPPRCQHCGLDRRRADTYVVLHDDGRQMQIGRTCLKDFTGHESPEAVARWAELLASFVASVRDGDSAGGGSGELHATLDDYLPYVVASVTMLGWLSRTAARDRGGMATADHAWGSLFPNPLARRDTLAHPTAADGERGARALAVARTYFEEHDVASLSEYEHNLRLVVEGVSVYSKTMGIAASLLNFAERLIGKEIERRRSAERALTSQHVGVVGKREEFTLTVEKVIDLESQFGVSHLHLMADAAGNVVKWFSSTARLEVGLTYVVKGTVKDPGRLPGRQADHPDPLQGVRLKLTARDKDIMHRCLLAESFTSPAGPIRPRIEYDEFHRLIKAGLVVWRNGFRLTDKGKKATAPKESTT